MPDFYLKQTTEYSSVRSRTLTWSHFIHYFRPVLFSVRVQPRGPGSLSYPGASLINRFPRVLDLRYELNYRDRDGAPNFCWRKKCGRYHLPNPPSKCIQPTLISQMCADKAEDVCSRWAVGLCSIQPYRVLEWTTITRFWGDARSQYGERSE